MASEGMFVLLILGALGLVYLILTSAGDLDSFLPEKLHAFLARFSAASVFSALFAALALVTGRYPFVIGAYFIFGVFAALFTIQYVVRMYHGHFGKDTKESWICRKCGEENAQISMECRQCGARRVS